MPARFQCVDESLSTPAVKVKSAVSRAYQPATEANVERAALKILERC